MDTKHFGKAYPERLDSLSFSSVEQKELLAAPRAWMRFFNQTLTEVLTNDTTESVKPAKTHEEFQSSIAEYIHWVGNDLYDTSHRLTALVKTEQDKREVEELRFHSLNVSIAMLWQFLYEGVPVPRKLIDSLQIATALNAFPLIKQHRQLTYTNPSQSEAKQMLSGHLTEADTIITLLEILKTHPELLFVPAPTQFESNSAAKTSSGSKNNDFIIIDIQQRHAHGIQVKTSGLTKERYEEYDPDFVTLVEGSTDFGNQLFRDRHRVSSPGLLTLSFLSNQPLKANVAPAMRPVYMQSRLMARELSRDVRPYLQHATKSVGSRVLHNLYKIKNPSV